jgi:MSHA pilin protein MshC
VRVSDRGIGRGFTLVELVLVMTIAGVLAAVAVPRMVDRSAFQTHGGAAEIRTALRYAQKLALAKNREVCVATTATPDLTLTFNPTTTIGAACGSQVIRPDGSSPNYTVTLPAGIGLVPITAFRFNAQGRPTNNAGALLNAVTTLTVGGSAQILVEPETGYVH